MKEILKKLLKYEIIIKKAVNNHFQGDFHSVFKGSGIEFDDVRSYQYGDDIRNIHWIVTAKGHGAYVKTYKEEKEQNVFFVLDVSASQQIGVEGNQKIDIGKELTSLLSMSALREKSQVGVICFSDRLEKYIKTGKGNKHAYEIINTLYKLEPTSKKTNLSDCIKYTLGMLKRKSVVFLISDFVDEDYIHPLKGLARKHDLIIIKLFDKREVEFPNLGIVPLYENETGKQVWVNSSSSHFRNIVGKNYDKNTETLQDICKRNNIDFLTIDTQENYIPKLIKLFSFRNKKGSKSAK